MQELPGYAASLEHFAPQTSTILAADPTPTNARFGRRPLSEKEKQAAFYTWHEIGRRMDIKEIPETLEELERYNVDFEREHFRYAESNHQLAVARRDLFLGWFLPKPLRPLGERAIYAVMDDPLLDACGFPRPSVRMRRLVEGALKLRARLVRMLPPRRRPRLLTRQRHPTYPHGYRIDELGPTP